MIDFDQPARIPTDFEPHLAWKPLVQREVCAHASSTAAENATVASEVSRPGVEELLIEPSAQENVVVPELSDLLLSAVPDLPHLCGQPWDFIRWLVVETVRPPHETGRAGNMRLVRCVS